MAARPRSVKRSRIPSTLLQSNAWNRLPRLLVLNIWMISVSPTLAHGTEADKDANGNIWSDANLATALGGITNGVKTWNFVPHMQPSPMAGTISNRIYYTQILDHDGNVLIENTSVSRSVIKDSTAYLLTSAMEDVVKKGTGTACQLDNMTVAGKTGTTEDYNDLWFVGYTPYYTCAVWSGYDNNEKIPEDARNFHKISGKKL